MRDNREELHCCVVHKEISKRDMSLWEGQLCFFFSSRRRHTRSLRDWSSDVCSSDLSDAGGRRRRCMRPQANTKRSASVWPRRCSLGCQWRPAVSARTERWPAVPDPVRWCGCVTWTCPTQRRRLSTPTPSVSCSPRRSHARTAPRSAHCQPQQRLSRSCSTRSARRDREPAMTSTTTELPPVVSEPPPQDDVPASPPPVVRARRLRTLGAVALPPVG